MLIVKGRYSFMENSFAAQMFDRKFKRKRSATMFFEFRRIAFYAVMLSVALYVAACAPRESSVKLEAQTGTATASKTSSQNINTQAPDGAPPIVSAHGGTFPPLANSRGDAITGAANKPDVDTTALDAKIARVERKAKAPKASEADKRRAAAAYLERGNVFYNAQQSSLYKFALRDLRHVLRYEPDNTEAREKVETIVSIYHQLNRPVPELGNEP